MSIQDLHVEAFDEFESIINEIKTQIDNVRTDNLTQQSFCNILNTYMIKVQEIRTQLCGVLPKAITPLRS